MLFQGSKFFLSLRVFFLYFSKKFLSPGNLHPTISIYVYAYAYAYAYA